MRLELKVKLAGFRGLDIFERIFLNKDQELEKSLVREELT
jgi:hypothetical protein